MTRRDHPSRTSVWLTSSTCLRPDRLALLPAVLIHHAAPFLLSVSLPVCACPGEMHLNSVTGPERRFAPPVGPPSLYLSGVIHSSCQPLTESHFRRSLSDIGSCNQSSSVACKKARGTRLVSRKIVQVGSSSSKLLWMAEGERSIWRKERWQAVNDGRWDWNQCYWVKTAFKNRNGGFALCLLLTSATNLSNNPNEKWMGHSRTGEHPTIKF